MEFNTSLILNSIDNSKYFQCAKENICNSAIEINKYCIKYINYNTPYLFYSLLISVALILFSLSSIMQENSIHKKLFIIYGKLLLYLYLILIWWKNWF